MRKTENTLNTKNFLWNAVGTAVNSVMSFVYLITLTRLNGIDVAGLFSVCFSVSIILFTFQNLGNRVYEVSDRDGNDGLYLTVKLLACVISLIIALLICFLFGYSLQKSLVVILLTLVRCVESFSDTYYAVFQKNDKLYMAGISYVLKNAVCYALFIVADLFTRNIIVTTASILLGTVLVYYLYDKQKLIKDFQKISFVRNLKESLNLIKEVSFFVIFNLVVIVIANIPRLIADTKYSDEEMGFFSIIIMIPTVMALLGQMIIQPSINSLTMDFALGNLTRFSKSVFKNLAVMFLCAIVCGVCAYYIGPPVLGFILGLDLADYALVMTVAIVAGMFNILTTFLSMALTIMRRTFMQLIFYIIALLVECAFIIFSLKFNNFDFIIWAFAAAMAVQFIEFAIYYIYSFYKEKIK